MISRWLPNKRDEAVFHTRGILRITGKVTAEQFLFVEKTNDENGDHGCEADEPPPRTESERGAKQHDQGTEVHRVPNERIRAC